MSCGKTSSAQSYSEKVDRTTLTWNLLSSRDAMRVPVCWRLSFSTKGTASAEGSVIWILPPRPTYQEAKPSRWPIPKFELGPQRSAGASDQRRAFGTGAKQRPSRRLFTCQRRLLRYMSNSQKKCPCWVPI